MYSSNGNYPVMIFPQFELLLKRFWKKKTNKRSFTDNFSAHKTALPNVEYFPHVRKLLPALPTQPPVPSFFLVTTTTKLRGMSSVVLMVVQAAAAAAATIQRPARQAGTILPRACSKRF
ncbi:hypothetical protein ElyMa_003317900 [Elysia marginata]|uniref:Uncharacterized protein n=1 Tax=Elysia marginata TaxID=1093978 RepID=A0AAV4JFR1_9GAST|nr:hypothetical protein ElyMa_003317900 [Elysia marginata]